MKYLSNQTLYLYEPQRPKPHFVVVVVETGYEWMYVVLESLWVCYLRGNIMYVGKPLC